MGKTFQIQEKGYCSLLQDKPVETSIRSPRTLNLGRAGGTLCGRGHSIRTVLPSCTDSDRRLPSSYSDISVVTEEKEVKLSARNSQLPAWSRVREGDALVLESSCLCWITEIVYCCSE